MADGATLAALAGGLFQVSPTLMGATAATSLQHLGEWSLALHETRDPAIGR